MRVGYAFLFLGVLCSVVLLDGCGNATQEEATNDHPAPGAMRVVSVTPVQAAQENIFPEGDFENWYSGSPVPSPAFVVPGDASKIYRSVRKDGVGGKVLAQEWKKKDYQWNIEGRHKIQFAGLQKNTDYRVTLDALVPNGEAVRIELRGVKEGDESYLMQRPFMTLEPGSAWQTSSASFSTGVLTDFVLATGCFKMPEEGKQRLFLDNIRLREIGKTSYPKATADENNLIPNGAFSVWITGKPLPEGPFAFSSEHSTLKRSAYQRADNTFSVEQRWSANDAAEDPKKWFGVEVDNLTANTDYTFSTEFSIFGKYFLAVSVFGVEENGALTPIAHPLLSLGGEKIYSASKSFNTGTFSKIRIVSHVPKATSTFPNTVSWNNFKLVPGAEK